jgi:uncharacterized protein YdaU (DUF1376 family)
LRWRETKVTVPSANGPIEALAEWYWKNRKELHRKPYVPNYHKDWLSSADFMTMTLSQRGAYFTMVLFCSQEPIKSDMVLRGVGVANDQRNWKRWILPAIKDHFVVVSDGYYQHKRILKEFARRAREHDRYCGKRKKFAGNPPDSHASASASREDDDRTSSVHQARSDDGNTLPHPRIPQNSAPIPDRDLFFELQNSPWEFLSGIKLTTIVTGKNPTDDNVVYRPMKPEDLDAWEEYAQEHGRAAARNLMQKYRHPDDVPEDPANKPWKKKSRRVSSYADEQTGKDPF